MTQLGEKWNYTDARYKKKKISTYILEAVYGIERGGEIRIWKKIDSNWMGEEYEPRSGGYYLLERIHFMDYKNLLGEYDNIKNVKGIWDITKRSQ
ncbi:hypothetical protein KKG81_10760 [bacterium]|nr:hypothetical protein [bacterium]